MIPGFEAKLLGKAEGDAIDFSLTPEQAFGEYNTELVIDVPKQAFVINGEMREDLLYIGNEISMMDHQGNPARGKVTQVNGDNVQMDFNHPLAGKSLFITGKVMHVRPITQEDLEPKGGCCGGSCGCGPEGQTEEEHAEAHAHHEDENCGVCGNPPELQGQGIGDCRCGS
jgi:FKBP-type peptidyl-prolyl cis-trans isomerase SlyD